jgi:Ca-activated chloride channel family protein
MRFADPWLLVLLAGPFWLALRSWWTRRRLPAARLGYPVLRFLEGAPASSRLRWRPLSPVLGLTGLALLVVALARPQRTGEVQEVHTQSRNIMIVLDISSSMKSADFQPGNRLEAAKRVVAEFVQRRQGDLLGLVVFSGRAFLQAPLGPDTRLLGELIDQVQLGELPDGTAIGTAITLGLGQLKDLPPTASTVILLTDGANNTGEPTPLAAAEAARALGIRIYAVGLSTVDTSLSTDAYVWREGRTADRLLPSDEAVLTRMATRSGGQYFRATDPALLQEIMDQIDPLERADVRIAEVHDYRELFPFFLVPGLLLLALQSALTASWLRSLP